MIVNFPYSWNGDGKHNNITRKILFCTSYLCLICSNSSFTSTVSQLSLRDSFIDFRNFLLTRLTNKGSSFTIKEDIVLYISTFYGLCNVIIFSLPEYILRPLLLSFSVSGAKRQEQNPSKFCHRKKAPENTYLFHQQLPDSLDDKSFVLCLSISTTNHCQNDHQQLWQQGLHIPSLTTVWWPHPWLNSSKKRHYIHSK